MPREGAPPESSQARAAHEALARVARESEVVGGSSVSRTVRRLEDHFAGRDAEPTDDGRPDPIEIWGRRIGRAISVLVCIGLAVWLGVQLGWWRLP